MYIYNYIFLYEYIYVHICICTQAAKQELSLLNAKAANVKSKIETKGKYGW
jgi:hypothetical protein